MAVVNSFEPPITVALQAYLTSGPPICLGPSGGFARLAEGRHRKIRYHTDMAANSRAEGERLGRIYYTGKQCRHGHGALRLVSDGRCVTCARLKSKRQKAADAAKLALPKPETREQRLRRLNDAHAAWVKEMTAR
jgi:hypothetical protein